MVDGWLQQPGESDAAYAAFVSYRDVGPGRTVDEAYRRSKGVGAEGAPRDQQETKGGARAPGRWREWAKEWSWKDRATAYDNRVQDAVVEARVEVVRQVEAAGAHLWAQRAHELREAEWTARKRLVDMADKLAAKLIERLDDETADITLSAAQVAKAYETASKIGRLSVGLETDRPASVPVPSTSLEDMTPEELDEYERSLMERTRAATRH